MKNIILIIWDACSDNTATENAPFLQELADKNLTFSNAITPAGWSLPAHASLFTGQYPHEHNITRVTDNFEKTPQIKVLSEKGYNTIGISGNGFASPRFNLHTKFDKFISTHEEMIYPGAFDVRRHMQEIKRKNKGEFKIKPLELAYDVVTDSYPLRSVINAAAAALNFSTRNDSWLNKVPHRRFQSNGGFGYDPNKNNSALINSTEKEPFFIFSNYMNTHRPYDPPENFQKRYFDEPFGLSELVRLDHLSHPYEYAERKSLGNEIDEDELKKIRKLHYAEVQYADQLLEDLYYNVTDSSTDETIFIITADHGENLGRPDLLGEKWMGHWNSSSEELLNVPLVIAGENIPSIEIIDHFSTRNILPLIQESLFETEEGLNRSVIERFTEEIILSEYPLTGRRDLLNEKYDISEEFMEREIIVGYQDGVKYILMDDGTEVALELATGTRVSPPASLVSETKQARTSLTGSMEESPDDTLQSQLEDLGYL